VRRALVPLGVVATLLVSAAPAAQPDHPVSFISVDELKATLDRGVKGDIIDVRNWDAYVDMHIKGARSMPLRAVPDRAAEIRKTGLVVLY
jgi:rhodanese-related sulfurtransferase